METPGSKPQFSITRKRANWMLGVGLVQLFGPLIVVLIGGLVLGWDNFPSIGTFGVVLAVVIVLAGLLSVVSALGLRKYIRD